MWPTFFIPTLAAGTPNAGLDYLCGVNETPYSIPAPASIQDGQLQVVMVSPSADVSGWPDYATDGWRELFSGAAVNTTGVSFGRGYQRMFWRFWQTGDADLVVPTAANEVCWVSVSFSNANAADPFLTAWAFTRNSTPYGGSPLFPANYIRPSAIGDAILQWTSDTQELASSTEASANDIEFSCKNTGINPVNDFEGHIVTGLYANYNVNNLLMQSSRVDNAAWTKVGLTTSAPIDYGSPFRAPSIAYPTTDNTAHYFEQDVTLEAGKYYMMSGRVGRLNGVATTVWFTYIKPDASEHGLGYRTSATRYDLPGSTEVLWADGLASVINNTSDNVPSAAWDTFTVPFYCDTSGTYTFRVYSSDNGADPRTAWVANGNYWVMVCDLLVQEASEIAQQPSFYTTTSAAVAVGDVPYARLVPPLLGVSASDASRGFGGVIVRRSSSGGRPACTLFNPATRGTHANFTDLANGDTRYVDDPDPACAETAWASHLVYEFLATQKLYFEVYVSSYGTGGTSDYYGIGFAPFEAHLQSPRGTRDSFGAGQAFGAYNNQYAYQSSGKVYADGTLDGTYTAWSAGDYIGAAIDFQNWEISFYRNGTLIRTVTITNDRFRYALWAGACAWLAPATAASQARFEWNFAGPFSGRKPSGFSAYDFDNEVT